MYCERTQIAPPGASAEEIVANAAAVGLSAVATTGPFADVAAVNRPRDGACLPIVQMHGMGDFAMNPAYKQLGAAVSYALTGSKTACPLVTPQLGPNAIVDIVGGFLRPLIPSVRDLGCGPQAVAL